MSLFQSYYDEHAQLIASKIFSHPELGYKEFETSKTVLNEINAILPNAPVISFLGTGIKLTLNAGKTRTIAFVAELDAVFVPGHFGANSVTGAAHACGHFTQVTVALSLLNYFVKSEEWRHLNFNIAFIFVPAEEYVDLAFRRRKREQGKIVYFGGKPEAMRLGVFDDIDAVICIHAIGETFAERTIELNCNLAGFAYKTYTFEGQASHAGFDPFSGVNAYSIATIFNNVLGLMRQQIREDEMIRFNPVITNADHFTPNVIPDIVRVGTDIRFLHTKYGNLVAKMMDQAARGAALSLGGSVTVHTEMGYLPFNQDESLSALATEAWRNFSKIPRIITNRGAIAAAGDIGDLGYILPSIQISHGGFVGRIHGNDFKLDDSEFVLSVLPEYVATVFKELSVHLDEVSFFKRSYLDYVAQLKDWRN